MTVIALTGYARSGKDTVGQILVDHHGFRRVAFGDVLKQIAEDMNPILRIGSNDGWQFAGKLAEILATYDGSWERVKDAHPETRQHLVDLGNSLRRRIPNAETSWWLEDAVLRGDNVVNTNVYHAEEIDRIRHMGGYVVRVRRPDTHPANADEARTGEHPVNAELFNAGTIDDLPDLVAEMLARLSPTVSSVPGVSSR